MTIHEFLIRDKKLYYELQDCERMIDDQSIPDPIKVIALTRRVEIIKERDELYDYFVKNH